MLGIQDFLYIYQRMNDQNHIVKFLSAIAPFRTFAPRRRP